MNGKSQEDFGQFLYNGSSIYECADNKVKEIDIKGKRSPILQVKKWNDSIYEVLADSEFVEYKNKVIKPIYPYHKQDERCKWLGRIFMRDYIDYGVIIHHLEFYDRANSGAYVLRYHFQLDEGKSSSDVILSKDKFIISIWGTGLFSLDTDFQTPLKKIWTGSVNVFYEDKDGNLWITTTDDGVYLLKSQNVINYSSDKGLKYDNLTSMAYDRGKLYFGNTNGELFSIEKSSLTKLDLKCNKPLERIRGITAIGDHLILISNTTILNYDINKGTSSRVPESSGGPKSILKLADGKTILVGLIGTVISYNIETGESKETQFLKRIIAMAQHPDGRVYCGSLDGLYLYQDNNFIRVDSEDTRLQGRISSLCFSPDSILWIGTPSGGIIAYNGTKIIGHVTTAANLSYKGAICRKVTAGHPNEIWVATNSGIDKIRYHIQDSVVIDNITPINTMDGLLSDDVNDILVHDSMIYVATYRGLTILNENELNKPRAAPVYISSFKVNDADSLIHDSEYELSYRQNNLQIEYIGVSLQSSGYMRYQYRLVGSSDIWQTTDRTSIDLRSVSPGHYTFEVAVLDKFGNRSTHIARVRFHIAPAFYSTVWFMILVIMLILGVGFYLIRYIFKRRQARYEKEQSYNAKIIELEQQALKAQMNPHFIFNCLTAIQHYVNKEDVYSANMYLSNFAKLIRKTLDLSGEQYITLDKEIAYLENYVELEKMRFQDKFQCYINVGTGVNVFTAMIPPMLLQPFIENAIRHGLRYKEDNEGELDVDFNMEGTTLVCRINDNGIGIKKSKQLKSNTHVEYQSKGMRLTESRINAINMISPKKIRMEVKDKLDDLGNPIGTMVVIYFEQ